MHGIGFNFRLNFLNFLLIILIFSIIPQVSFSQVTELRFTNLSVKNGLSHNSATCFYQDKKGFIWIGTFNGLNKFDGYNFTIYRNNPSDKTSISDNSITAIYEDDKGFLWIGTENGGLNKYNPEYDTFIHFKSDKNNPYSISHNKIYCIIADKQNNLWIGTNNGLNRLTPEERDKPDPHFQVFRNNENDSNSLSDNTVFSLRFDSKGALWVSLSGGFGIDILEFTDRNNSSFKKNRIVSQKKRTSGLSGDWILFTFEDSHGRIWISTWADGVTLYEPALNKYTQYRFTSGIHGEINCNDIENIIEDKRGNIWVATYGGGLNRFIEPIDNEKGYFIHYTYNSDSRFSIAGNRILRIFEDRAGIIWVGTSGHGISKFDPHSQFYNIRLTDKSGKSPLTPSAIYVTSDGNLWVGAKEGVLVRYDKSHKKKDIFKFKTDKKLNSRSKFVTSFFEDEDGTMWITTDLDGIYYCPSNTLSSSNPVFHHVENATAVPPVNFPGTFTFAKENYKKDLIFGSCLPQNIWILRRENKRKKIFNFDYYDFKRYCWSYENDGESAWFGSFSHGVAKTKFSDSKRQFQFDYSVDDPFGRKNIPNGSVHTILKSSDGSVWFGTEKSLSRLLPGTDTLIHYTPANGIAQECVYGILEDENRNIWVSTYNGLTKLNYKTNSITNYYIEDGIQGNEFNQYSYFKDKSGNLYFGGTSGITVIDPKTVYHFESNPEVQITRLHISNSEMNNHSLINNGITDKSISYSGTINLSYNMNVFAIEFSSLDYYDPEKTQYMYKLEGFDKDWIIAKAGMHMVNYMNLSPEKYTFKVRTADKEGKWSGKITQIDIIITPPFWNNRLIQIISLLLLSVLLISGYKIKNKAVIKKQKQLESLVEEKTTQLRESNAALESFSYSVSHDLRAPLRSVSGFAQIIKEDYFNHLPADAKEVVERIISSTIKMNELINSILKLSKLNYTNLSITDIDLSALCNQIFVNACSAYKNPIMPVIQTDMKIKADLVLITSMMENLIGNAIKFSSNNENIIVEIGTTGEFDHSKSSSSIAYYVKDYGVGFDPKYAHKLFQVFQRLHDVREFEGTGVGLANVKKIITRHGGVIWAESEIGRGTTFFFTLP